LPFLANFFLAHAQIAKKEEYCLNFLFTTSSSTPL
jgi:hypothetical protein